MNALLSFNASCLGTCLLLLLSTSGSPGQRITVASARQQSDPGRDGLQNPGFTPSMPRQLPRGQKDGTFAFNYSDQVKFTQEPAFPVTIKITDANRKTVAQTQATDGSPFTLTADLPPGSYDIVSNVKPAMSNIYGEANGPAFFINQAGLIKYLPSMLPSLLHQKLVIMLGPDNPVRETRPLLKWQPLNGAARYVVSWTVSKPDGRIDQDKGGTSGEITAAEYRLPEDFLPVRRYQWRVEAYDANGRQFGCSYFANLYGPGGEEAFHMDRQPAQVKSRASYLGISSIQSHGTFPGIIIVGIAPDSPALKAGLQPNDVLTSFDGNDLGNVTPPDFARFVQKMPPGAQAKVEYVRQAVKNSTIITIEAKP